MKQLCKETNIRYNLDLTASEGSTNLLIMDRGVVLANLPINDSRVIAYLHRCKVPVECSLCLEPTKDYIAFNGYTFCNTCQTMLKKGLQGE